MILFYKLIAVMNTKFIKLYIFYKFSNPHFNLSLSQSYILKYIRKNQYKTFLETSMVFNSLAKECDL